MCAMRSPAMQPGTRSVRRAADGPARAIAQGVAARGTRMANRLSRGAESAVPPPGRSVRSRSGKKHVLRLVDLRRDEGGPAAVGMIRPKQTPMRFTYLVLRCAGA